MGRTPELLISPHDLVVGAGTEASDMRAIALAVLELKDRLEATLNRAVANAEMTDGIRRDCRCDVDAIADAMDELAGFFAHAADAVDANDALPLDRERGET